MIPIDEFDIEKVVVGGSKHFEGRSSHHILYKIYDNIEPFRLTLPLIRFPFGLKSLGDYHPDLYDINFKIDRNHIFVGVLKEIDEIVCQKMCVSRHAISFSNYNLLDTNECDVNYKLRGNKIKTKFIDAYTGGILSWGLMIRSGFIGKPCISIEYYFISPSKCVRALVCDSIEIYSIEPRAQL